MKKTVLILAALMLAVSACIRDKIPEGAELGPGDRLPEFSVILDDGSVVSTGDLSGKVSVIVFVPTVRPNFLSYSASMMNSVLKPPFSA